VNRSSRIVLLAILQTLAASATAAEFTAEQDHRRMMQLLGIETLRPGANYFPEPGSPNNANYDESKANPYPDLPPLLRLQDGRAVTSPRLWSLRRAEIREAFDREVYGRVPTVTPKVRWQVVSTTNERIGGVAAVTRRLLGRVDNSAFTRVSVEIEMVLTLPGESKTAVPVMLRLGFIGPSPWPEGPLEPGPDWKAQLLATGWGFAILEANSIQPDDGAALTRGIIGLANRGQPRDADDWGALRAWAWGASRALDYLQDVRGVDAKRVGIEGLSRHGKAALVALAYDPRFAIGFIGSSGAGGAKLHRRDFGERVENLAAPSEYHWMAGNYIKYAGPLTAKDLPIDAHALIALCAPRPVFISAGAPEVENEWGDARGMFMAAVAAGPAYRLLGKRDLGTAVYPPIATPLVDGEIAFRQHRGGHSTAPNWATFIEYARRYFDSTRS
jgi:hypothetical protein